MCASWPRRSPARAWASTCSRAGSGAGAEMGERAFQRIAGVGVHRVPEPGWPRDLDRFVAWVDQMNEDMLAAGEALCQERSYDLDPRSRLAGREGRRDARRSRRHPVHHDDPRDRARSPPGLGPGRAAGPHPRRRALDGEPRGPRDRVLALHARPRRGHLRPRREPRRGDPQRRRPGRPAPGRGPAGAARAVRRARAEARAAGRAAGLREGLPARARRDAGPDRAARQRALPRRRQRHPRGGAEGAGASASG